MLRIIGIGLAVAVALLVVYATTRPDIFRVERSLAIKAPPEKIFPLLNDLKGWSAWSPYEKKDPAMKRSFGAVTAGKGATYGWEGNKNVGKGSMEITESAQPSKIVIKLDFLEPFEAHNTAMFTLEGKGEATTVTWAMFGPANFVSKLMGIFFDMDKMVGTDFEAGLASLKTIAEK
jgi:uncharacterized protein YndB with AHSA1/START domain